MSSFMVYCRTLTGQHAELCVMPSDTIRDIAERCRYIFNINDHYEIRVLFAGTRLEYGNRISYYNIRHGNTLHLVLGIRHVPTLHSPTSHTTPTLHERLLNSSEVRLVPESALAQISSCTPSQPRTYVVPQRCKDAAIYAVSKARDMYWRTDVDAPNDEVVAEELLLSLLAKACAGSAGDIDSTMECSLPPRLGKHLYRFTSKY